MSDESKVSSKATSSSANTSKSSSTWNEAAGIKLSKADARAAEAAAEAAKEATARSKRASVREKADRNGGSNAWKRNYNDCCWGISCADYSIFLVCFFFLYCVVALLVYIGLTLNIVGCLRFDVDPLQPCSYTPGSPC